MSRSTANKHARRAHGVPYFRELRWASRSPEIRDSRVKQAETGTGGSLRPGSGLPGTCGETVKHPCGLPPVSDTTIRTRNTICGLRSFRLLAQAPQLLIPFSATHGRHPEPDIMASTRSQCASDPTLRSFQTAISL